MKKLLYLFLFGLLFLLSFVSQAQTEKVDDFDVDIVINQDSSFIVTETITYNFGTLQRHGIYRDIPVKYKRTGGNYNIRLKVLSVTDENGKAWKYQESTKFGGDKQIKIGNADKYVTGQRVYVIKYEVKRAINYFDDHDELYWNVTGDEWQVRIEKARVTVHLPISLEFSQLHLECFTGKFGSQESDCNKKIVDERTLLYEANGMLPAYEGLTIVAGWPKGVVKKPDFWQNLIWIITDNWFFSAPLLVLLILLYLWYTAGRDPRGKGMIIPHYEPPANLPPGAMGVVLDEKADLKDISATVIDLAVRGYLKIKEIEKKKLIGKSSDYEFIKLNEADNKLTDYEKKIFKGIFDSKKSEKLSDLKNEFYIHLKKIKELLYGLVVKDGYFPFNPDRVRATYSGVGIAVCILSFVAGFIFNAFLSGVSIFVSGIIIIIFSRFMPRKTQRGAETIEEILGFKMFLSVTEKDRIKFHNAPEKKPEQFEKFLPYAIIFGVEKEWAKQFKGIYNTPPSWYEGYYTGAFTAAYLAGNLNSMSSNMNSTIVSRPGGGGAGGSVSGFGGGFSGGGFGGGGGGSW